METTEKKVSHTPGPWKIRYGSGIDMKIMSEHGKICEFRGYSHSVELMDENEEEERANAKLVAAAPELLEALKMCLPVVSEFSSKAYFAAKEAIKKATE